MYFDLTGAIGLPSASYSISMSSSSPAEKNVLSKLKPQISGSYTKTTIKLGYNKFYETINMCPC